MKKAIIFDIDGTLADASHRLHFIQGPSKNWKAFFDSMGKDQPIDTVCTVFGFLYLPNVLGRMNVDTEIVFCTGRPESHRSITERWICKTLTPDPLRIYMRKTGDHRPDHVVKEEMIEQMRADGLEPFIAFEDRTRCVEMWRKNGITCLQVADGNY